MIISGQNTLTSGRIAEHGGLFTGKS